jgi:hypothetical protein
VCIGPQLRRAIDDAQPRLLEQILGDVSGGEERRARKLKRRALNSA